jgi:hypothetical protein
MIDSDFVSPNCFPLWRETIATKSIALVREARGIDSRGERLRV